MLKVGERALGRGTDLGVVVVLCEAEQRAPHLAIRGRLARLRENREARSERDAHGWARVAGEADELRHQLRERADALRAHCVTHAKGARVGWRLVLMLTIPEGDCTLRVARIARVGARQIGHIDVSRGGLRAHGVMYVTFWHAAKNTGLRPLGNRNFARLQCGNRGVGPLGPSLGVVAKPKQEPKKLPDGEHRWPAVIAVLVAIGLYATLPDLIPPAVHFTVVAVCAALVIPLVAINPVRFVNETALGRRLSISQAVILFVANQVAVVLLVIKLTQPDPANGSRLLLSAAQVWVINVIVVALVLWEMDRGGPFKRWSNPRSAVPAADLRFSQDEDDDVSDEVKKSSAFGKEDWRPQFFDYFYSSLIQRDGVLRLRLDAAVAAGQGNLWARGAVWVRDPGARDRARGVAAGLERTCTSRLVFG